MFWAWVLLLAGLVASAPLQYDEQARGDEVTTELGKKLKETLEHLLEKAKIAVDQGKLAKKEIYDQIEEVRQKLKDLKIDIGQKAKDLYKRVKQGIKDWFKKVWDDLTTGDSSLQSEEDLLVTMVALMDEEDLARLMFAAQESSIRELWDRIKEKFGDWKIVIGERHARFGEWVKKTVGELMDKAKDRQERLQIMAKKYIENMKDLSGKVRDEGMALLREYRDQLGGLWEEAKNKYKELKKDDQVEDSPADVWNKIKEYYRDLKLNIKEHLAKFGEWLKETAGDALDNSKSHMERIRIVARKFIDHLKFLSKDVREQGLEFLRQYKEELGGLWEEVVRTFKEAAHHDLEEEQHGIEDIWNDIKGFFKKIGLDLKQKYAKFGEWVKKEFSGKLDTLKTKIEKVKKIAQKYIEEVKKLRDDVRDEGITFLKEYKEELGGVWGEAKEAFKKAGGDVQKILGDGEVQKGETWDRVKEYFRDLKLKLKEKFSKFGEWVKETAGTSLENAADHVERIKIIAERYKRYVRYLHDDVRKQGLEFLSQYKEYLGDLWHEVVKSFKDAVRKEVSDEDEVQESLKDIMDKVRDWFEKMKLTFKEKFTNLGEWLKSQKDVLLEKAGTRLEKLKRIADLVKDHLKEMHKDLRDEAMDYLKEYKEKLGDHWKELKDEYNKIKEKHQ